MTYINKHEPMNLYMYPDHVYHLKIMYVYNIILYNIPKDECMYNTLLTMSCHVPMEL